VVHQARDEWGLLEVVEDGPSRSLHFGSAPKQSTLLLADPHALALTYTRAMAAALLFQLKPQRALVVGLGGGSLVRYLLRYFPDCRIDAVELRPQVEAIARSHFQLPESPRLGIHIDDAGHFLRNADTTRFGDYDLLLVDAYDHAGISGSVCGLSFLEACRTRLSDEGVLSINLWADDHVSVEEILEDLRATFAGQVLRLPVEQRANIIALATQSPAPRRRLRRLSEAARRLEAHTGTEFPRILKQLRRYNRWLPL